MKTTRPTLYLAGAVLAGVLGAAHAAPVADCSTGAIAATPVRGVVNGKPFVPQHIDVHITKDGMALNEAKFDKYDLTLMTDGIFNALNVGMLVPLNKKPDGRVFRALAIDSIGAQPAAAPGLPEIQNWDIALEAASVDTSFTRDVASIRVEWGARQGAILPGKIHFCVPSAGVDISGSFAATVL